MFFAIGQDAEIKKKQSDPIAFILGDDKPMSIGEKVSHLPTKLISAIDLAIRKSYKSALRPHRVVIPVKTGIHCFQWLLDPPVKPEDDKYRLYKQTLNNF